jgi:hypothetical protein
LNRAGMAERIRDGEVQKRKQSQGKMRFNFPRKVELVEVDKVRRMRGIYRKTKHGTTTAPRSFHSLLFDFDDDANWL